MFIPSEKSSRDSFFFNMIQIRQWLQFNDTWHSKFSHEHFFQVKEIELKVKVFSRMKTE